MALGCSTNTVLHLLAIAYEAGVPIDLKLFNEISAKTPNLCHLAPAGPTHMPDLYAAGGIPPCRQSWPRRACWTWTCPPLPARRWVRTSRGRAHPQRQGHPPHREPLLPHRRLADPVGQHRPGRVRGQAQRRGPGDAGAFRPGAGLQQRGGSHRFHLRGQDRPGDVVVIRYEGPKGGPGMREMLNPTSALAGMKLDKTVALITDGRFSGASPRRRHRPRQPERRRRPHRPDSKKGDTITRSTSPSIHPSGRQR